jgi:hypothetical protein
LKTSQQRFNRIIRRYGPKDEVMERRYSELAIHGTTFEPAAIN